jgi:Tfp pilus assembly protein FimT
MIAECGLRIEERFNCFFNPKSNGVLMRERNNSRLRRERGISVIELLIVVAMIGVVTGFAVTQIAGAQRAMRLTNSAREFMAWLEKARLDSVRRNPMSPGEMARVEITAANSYTVYIDQSGDGVLDPGRTVTIPASQGLSFSGIDVPQVIRFNWRGRPEDGAGNRLNLSFSLQSTAGDVDPVPINLTSAGDASLYDNINASPVAVDTTDDGSANVKASTKIP